MPSPETEGSENDGSLPRSILRLEAESRKWQLETQALGIELEQSRQDYQALSAQRDQLVQDLHDLAIEKDRLQDQLKAIQESTSWKVASKMARAARFMRP